MKDKFSPPKMRRIDLSKGSNTGHPEFVPGKQYLVLMRHRDLRTPDERWLYEYSVGQFSGRDRDNFHPNPWGSPYQYDKPGANSSSFLAVWELLNVPEDPPRRILTEEDKKQYIEKNWKQWREDHFYTTGYEEDEYTCRAEVGRYWDSNYMRND